MMRVGIALFMGECYQACPGDALCRALLRYKRQNRGFNEVYREQIMPHLAIAHGFRDSEPRPTTNIPKALTLMVTAGLFIATSSAMIRGFGVGLPELESAFFRGATGFVILLLLMGTGVKKIPLGNNKKFLFFRGFFGSLASILYVWAICHMELGLANGLNQASPIFVCLCAALFLGERFGWWIYLTVFVAFFGMLLIASPDFTSWNFAALMALLSAIVSAIAYTFVKKLQSTETSDTIVLWFLGMSALLPLFSLPFTDWVMPPASDFAGLLGAGITCMFGQQLMTRAYRYAPATIVAPFIYASTISSLIIGYFVWGEFPCTRSLIGCGIIIVAAIAIGLLPKARRT